MRKRALALVVITAIATLVVLGYLLSAGRRGPSPATAAATWPNAPVRVAIAVDDYPLFFESGSGQSGLIADLLRQTRLGDQTWEATVVGPDDALAALSAGSVDLCISGALTGEATPRGTDHAPIVSRPVSLLAADPIAPGDGLTGAKVAWHGPDGLAALLAQHGAVPMPVLSADECLTLAATREVFACAIDEGIGVTNAARLGIGGLYVTGDSIAMVQYSVSWRDGQAGASGAVIAWVENARASGLLSSLERRWLGERVAGAESAPGSPWAGVLAVTATITTAGAVGAGLRARSLHRTMGTRQRQWRDAETRYRALINGSTDAVFVLTPEETEIVDASGSAEDLTGYGAAELRGMRFHQLVPARHRRLLREWFLDEGGGSMADVPLVRRDGTVATVTLRSAAIAGAERGARLCIARDMTERRTMLRETKRVTQLAERILESITNAVVTVDSDCRITSANRAFCQAAGTDGQCVGRLLDDVGHVEGEPLSHAVSEAMAEGETLKRHVVLLSAAGRQSPTSITVSLLRDEQAISGAVLVLADVSQESRMRDEWQRLATLSALGQMSGVLAHDIRNRVSGVHVGVQYLAEKFSEDDPRRKSMEFIRTETDRVVQVIDDILMLIRPGRVDKAPCRIGDVIERVVRAQAADAQRRKVRVTATVAQDAPPVRADLVQLERALANLVKNAVEAVPVGGLVEITADTVTRGEDGQAAEHIRVRVSDNGPGIPAAIRGWLFQPFATEKTGGTGLGLSIAKHIVDEHGGSIDYESREGRGTTFTVLLPAIVEREK